MAGIDRITYTTQTGSGGKIYEKNTTFQDQATSDHWWQRLEHWLRVGIPESRAYLNFGSEAAFIRWYVQPRSLFDWDFAQVQVGSSNLLTGSYSLEFINPDPMTPQQAGRTALQAKARSAQATEQLASLLAHTLRGERRVNMPWTAPMLPEAVMWSLLEILDMIGDTRPVSFFTCLSWSMGELELPGLFVGFRPGLSTVLPPDPGYMALAKNLADRFAADPGALRNLLASHKAQGPATGAGRITHLLGLLSASRNGSRTEGTGTLNTSFNLPECGTAAGTTVPSAPEVLGKHRNGGPGTIPQTVLCPMCLHKILDWDSLDYWRWDSGATEYIKLPDQTDLNDKQRQRALHGVSVRCPSEKDEKRVGAHYLPADYGRFGPPVVLGFVGLTSSGKSHLLASMVGAIMERELGKKHGIAIDALDHATHRRYMTDWVNPLKQGKVLPGTREGVVTFADAFVVKARGGPERVVALFDVAGGDLAKLGEQREFLWIADGLFFVIDAERLTEQWADDETFSNVLDVVRSRARNEAVSAAIVLNKADVLRFEETIDRWLRSEDVPKCGLLDPVEFLRESADLYAFLDERNALAMAEPYQACERATMHVVSPTGGAKAGAGGVYPRGVTPRRVLRPLVAMLAMTGVLTGPEAEQVGV